MSLLRRILVRALSRMAPARTSVVWQYGLSVDDLAYLVATGGDAMR